MVKLKEFMLGLTTAYTLSAAGLYGEPPALLIPPPASLVGL
jgi:hypothetical protein